MNRKKELIRLKREYDGLIISVKEEEFYRPTLEEFIKLRRNRQLIEHILNGGLVCRRVESEEQKRSKRKLTPFGKMTTILGIVLFFICCKLLIKFLEWLF